MLLAFFVDMLVWKFSAHVNLYPDEEDDHPSQRSEESSQRDDGLSSPEYPQVSTISSVSAGSPPPAAPTSQSFSAGILMRSTSYKGSEDTPPENGQRGKAPQQKNGGAARSPEALTISIRAQGSAGTSNTRNGGQSSSPSTSNCDMDQLPSTTKNENKITVDNENRKPIKTYKTTAIWKLCFYKMGGYFCDFPFMVFLS